ncbi:unnamed protein product [Meloidogyne enterolobii]|uniref:Uncharacterized protein n=1 Tax=Meloidogyne enterolobii TaxID=390850 RepID=A0ACB1A1L1_MELEN
MQITINAANETGQQGCPICNGVYNLEHMFQNDDFIETSKCENEPLYHFFHRSCMFLQMGTSGSHQACPTCGHELNIIFHPDADQINQNLRKIDMGFALEPIKDSYKNRNV